MKNDDRALYELVLFLGIMYIASLILGFSEDVIIHENFYISMALNALILTAFSLVGWILAPRFFSLFKREWIEKNGRYTVFMVILYLFWVFLLCAVLISIYGFVGRIV